MASGAINKDLLKTTLEEMMAERNPELQSILEELLVKILSAQHHSDRSVPLDMQEIRRRYGLRREAFAPFPVSLGQGENRAHEPLSPCTQPLSGG